MKEKISYLEINYSNQELDVVFEYVEENKINLAELKPRPPYVLKVLRPSNIKNHVEPSRNNNFGTKNNTFDVTNASHLLVYQ